MAEQEDTQGNAPQNMAMKKSVERASSSGSRVTLRNDEIEIFSKRNVPEWASPGTIACHAQDHGRGTNQIAILCRPNTIPRLTQIASYKTIRSLNILQLQESGVVYLAEKSLEYLALVFDRPLGARLMETLDTPAVKIGTDRIVSTFIQPLLHILSDLKKVEMVHGAIRPDNIFISGQKGNETVVLGECLSSAPYLHHGVLLQPIERAMAQKSGRGHGTEKDDLYALGVCLCLCLRGENPVAQLSDDQILRSKIENGSYSTLMRGVKVPNRISIFLRGVLKDTVDLRWDLDDALSWLDEGPPLAKRSVAKSKASRPFIFDEKKFWELKLLSHHFFDDPSLSSAMLDKEDVWLWIKRNFDDDGLERRIEELPNIDEALPLHKKLTICSMAFDYEGPIRYKGLSVLPGGFGTALAIAMIEGEDIQPYAELISQNFMILWLTRMFENIREASFLLSQIESAKNFLTQKMPSYGVERVVYQMDRECACLSPVIKKYFVVTPGALLRALEDISKKEDRPQSLLDRHMLSFISIRDSKMVDPYLGHIISKDPAYHTIGIIRTLAAIQKRYTTGALPGLGQWVVSELKPAIEKFHDRDLRQEISKHLNSLSDSGDISAILALVDTAGLIQDDSQRFLKARKEYELLTQQTFKLVKGLKGSRNFGTDTGRQVAMMISAAMSTICIMAFIALTFLNF